MQGLLVIDFHLSKAQTPHICSGRRPCPFLGLPSGPSHPNTLGSSALATCWGRRPQKPWGLYFPLGLIYLDWETLQRFVSIVADYFLGSCSFSGMESDWHYFLLTIFPDFPAGTWKADLKFQLALGISQNDLLSLLSSSFPPSPPIPSIISPTVFWWAFVQANYCDACSQFRKPPRVPHVTKNLTY